MTRLCPWLGFALLVCACGDDGKPKMYESCGPGVVCSADLFCLKGECTRACSIAEGSSQHTVGECPAATECAREGEPVGCCQLTVVSSDSGAGNCTVTPAAAAPGD